MTVSLGIRATSRLGRIWRMGATLAVAGLALVVSLSGAAAQSTHPLRETHGDWRIHCASDAECYMEQSYENADGEVLLVMRIRKLDGVSSSTGESIPASAIVLAPLGVYLPYGLQLDIDGAPFGVEVFVECQRIGCVSNPPLSEEIIDKLKAGAVATFRIRLLSPDQPTGSVVSAAISLSGFTAAFNAL